MTISEGAALPDGTLLVMGDNGAEQVSVAERLKGRKVVVFGLPGAFTSTCSTAHLPSFMRTKSKFDAKGVDEIICISVNDPFVMKAWGEATGATKAGITLAADADGAFTKAIGMNFDVPHLGFFGRSKRYAALIEDGVAKVVQIDKSGECNISTGEALLEAI
ncbi:peroxiredoxin [Neotabrizicola shimadae]|jgi:peroxiredoxin|uniref:Glutathione-dependent peroxiredoxin n=1 Tax=Neotabrizicola shimadae TaxID=2807096 RepID=A0A8G0ZSJ3_9RHOB|nr:peroxiredoxin [Neotabrizicola shimadae]QYZ69242.1 peroxiredoxin [Neotabrizicola shimadae]